jgi:autophagy-related protein 9
MEMMSSRVLSRFLPVAEGDVSVYEGLRQDTTRHGNTEAQRSPRDYDDFHDEDENPADFLYDATEEPSTIGDSPVMQSRRTERWQEAKAKKSGRRKSNTIEDDDVPDSLLVEPKGHGNAVAGPSRPNVMDTMVQTKLARAEAQWKATQEQQGLHASRAYDARHARPAPAMSRRSQPASTAPLPTRPNPAAEAMWLYTNANNLDAFLVEAYEYFVGHGVWSILLNRVLTLLTEAFVFGFAMFLSSCIDYSKIPQSKSTGEVLVKQCIAKTTWLKKAMLFFFIIYWLSKALQGVQDSRRLFKMRNFYEHVLGIGDDDLQTSSWKRVVDGLVKVQNSNIATANPATHLKKYLDYKEPQQRLNAETIANRLMRQTNYYVVFYNKDILDFTLPIPFVGDRQFYSKSLEWCIGFCMTNFIFDERGGIRPFCLEVKNRRALVEAMRSRFRLAALASIFLAPFNILRFCLIYFFRYYTEFTRNPSRASARAFTPFAEWKMRQLNELQHLFDRRLRQAYPFANDYLKQFPKDKTDQICRFVAFISGSFAAVLTVATLLDSELFLGFEVTPGRTVVFWLTVMGVIFGIAHGALPDENETHDPIMHLKDVLYFTHYMPSHWKGRLHSNEVRAEFSAMYQMKVLIFIEEVASLVLAPWILWRNSGKNCERIIDFFRETTVHVEGVGYQCNFAVFGFKKDPNVEDPTTMLDEPDGLRDDYYGLKDDKMAASMQNFQQYYSHYTQRHGQSGARRWQPPPSWPDVIPPPAIAEEEDGVPAAIPTRGTASARRYEAAPTSSRILSPQQRPFNPRRVRGGPFSPRSAPQTTLRGEPTGGIGGGGAGGITESRIMAQDSDLQEYADAPGAAVLESDTEFDDEPNGGGAVAGNAGVLGMLSQFAKAQTDKGGGAPGGVNI